MLDLDFTSEQDLLRDTVRGVCAQYSPLTTVRQLEDDATGYATDLWKQLAALDLLGLLIPEAHGGAGMDMLDGVVLYEELGRSLAPTPHFASSVLAAAAMVAAAHHEWLPRIASGEAVVVPAWLEPGGGYTARGVQARVDGGAITGVKRHVPYASSAARLLVVARDGDGTGEEGVGLWLVDPSGPGVTLTQQHSVASDTQYRVDLDGAPAERVGGWDHWQAAMYDGVILAAAQAVGGALAAQELTVQYAKDREQFGKPLGAFQALAHDIADRQTELDGARTLVHEAAWARTAGRSVAKLAPMAKLFACRTFRSVTATAQQIFGGNGFTVEYDVQLYFRRAKQLQLSWWDDRHLEDLIAAEVLR